MSADPRLVAMFLEFEDGRREYSPHVEVRTALDGNVTVTPIVPFRGSYGPKGTP